MQTTWRWLRVIAPIVVFLPVILACPTRPLEDPVAKTTKEDTKYYPQSVEKDIDLLFVIDNSDSMKEEQDNLAAQFPKLIDALRSDKLGGEGCSVDNLQKCNIPNIRIGVVSSDLGAGNYTSLASCQVPGGDGGRLQATQRIAGCSTPSDPWIQYVEGQTNIPNSSGDPVQDVKDAFKCIASLGRSGCGFEHQLESARRALDPELNINPGFLRPEAFLAVIFITDEDDCSAQKPQLFDPTQAGLTDPLGPLSSFRCFEFGINCDTGGRQPGPRKDCHPGGDHLYKIEDYANFFANVKPESRLIMFAIAGPTNPLKDVPLDQQPTAEVGLKNANPDLSASCERAGMGKGVPAIRIQSLVEHAALADKGHKGYFNGVTRPERVQGTQETVNICSPDFGPALKQLGEVIVASLGGQCLTSPPLTPNGAVACHAGDDLGGGQTCTASCLDQVECVIEEVTGQGTSAEKRAPVPKCPAELFDSAVANDGCGGSCPCWRIIPTSECDVAKGSPYGLNIMRVGEAAKGTVAVAKCQTSPFKWGSEAFLQLGQCQ